MIEWKDPSCSDRDWTRALQTTLISGANRSRARTSSLATLRFDMQFCLFELVLLLLLVSLSPLVCLLRWSFISSYLGRCNGKRGILGSGNWLSVSFVSFISSLFNFSHSSNYRCSVRCDATISGKQKERELSSSKIMYEVAVAPSLTKLN